MDGYLANSSTQPVIKMISIFSNQATGSMHSNHFLFELGEKAAICRLCLLLLGKMRDL